MLADPQSITLSGTATSLPRTGVTPQGAKYSSPDTSLTLSTVHNYGRRTRHSVQVRQDKIAADPLLTSANRRLSASVWLAIDVPPEGFSIAEQTALIKSLTDWLTASTMANAGKLAGGES